MHPALDGMAPREKNQLANALSIFCNYDDRKLNVRYFATSNTKWGIPTFNRCASAMNAHGDKFNIRFLCPGSAGIDAFAQHWGEENNWINSVFALIRKVMLHLQACEARGTVPFWPKQTWWHLIRSKDGCNWSSAVKVYVKLPNARDLFLLGPNSANSSVCGPPCWFAFALRVDLSTWGNLPHWCYNIRLYQHCSTIVY